MRILRTFSSRETTAVPSPGLPKVSICLPVFNGEKHVGAAIASALAQTKSEFELVIVDDNSSDGSWNIIQDWAAKDERISATRNTRGLGLFQNYNECMRRASGEFIKLFAQDDVLHPELLEICVQAFENQPQLRLVTCGKNWIDDNGATIKSVVQFKEDRFLKGREAILYNMMQLTNWIGEPSTALFRKPTDGTEFDTAYYHYGDLDLWFQLLRKGDLLYIAQPLVNFRRHEKSTTSGNLKGLFFVPDLFLLGKKYGDVLEEIGESHEHFNKRLVEMVAMEVKHLIDDEALDEAGVAAIKNRFLLGESERPEYTMFRQALFHSSARMAELMHELHDARETVKFRDKEIAELKATVDGITNSKIWKMTAPLRQLTRS